MDSMLMEELLNEDESAVLDFKRDQYPFVGATDDQKSELCKDILAFANAWRRADAYILIGVEEVKGGRSKVIGVSIHLDDSRLQQFVNSKTQRPLTFSYEAFPFDELQVGVIRIPLQDRPIYLTKDYGKLKKYDVYVRRGSSTDTANPDEISKMRSTVIQDSPTLSLIAKVTQAWRNKIVLSIKNDGGGIARAPYLSFTIPESYNLAQWDIDGNGTPGHLGKPHSGSNHRRPQYGAKSDVVIYPYTTVEVAAIEFSGRGDCIPKDEVEIEYELAAESMQPIRSRIKLNADRLTTG